jgi:hypothetical protein
MTSRLIRLFVLIPSGLFGFGAGWGAAAIVGHLL